MAGVVRAARSRGGGGTKLASLSVTGSLDMLVMDDLDLVGLTFDLGHEVVTLNFRKLRSRARMRAVLAALAALVPTQDTA